MHIKGVITVTLIGTVISLLFSPSDHLSWRNLYINTLYCFMIGASLWFGNFSINPSLEKIFRNKPLSPGWKFVLSIFSMFFLSAIIIIVVNWLWVVALWGNDFSIYWMGSGKFIMIVEMVVVLIIALVLYTNEFFHSWREAVKNEESLKREKLALQYESLKNQVNPHFLFNSLNTLTGLIGTDDEKATRFVKQLADIYRYVLEHKDREVVPLGTEMKFIENYISLMKIRFGDNLSLTSDIRENSTLRVVPLSIQMLVENAIKHNIVSSEKPLAINISIHGSSHLVVKNNLQKKSSVLKEDSGGWEKHGLANIKSRYEYLSHGMFEVNGASKEPFPDGVDGYFVVNIPLIK